MIKVIIADDHRMFRESLKKVLMLDKIAEVLGEAENGLELLELLEVHTPDIILMDIAMPEMNGVEATKKALQKQPNVKILALSGFDDDKYYYSMVEAGVKGFVLKNSGIAELKNAINEIYNNNSWFSSELMQKVISKLNAKTKKNKSAELSERELEILHLICESLTNDQIAEKLNLSSETIKWHRSNLLEKTGCFNTAGMVIYAIKNQLIEV